MLSHIPSNIAGKIRRSSLLCISCGHSWFVKGRANVTRTVPPFIKSNNVIRACPKCNEKNNLRILAFGSDEMGNGEKTNGGLPPFIPPVGKIAWLELARSYIGQREIVGGRDNPFILDCFKYTSYKASHDETPWCAAFVCKVLRDSHMHDTNNAAAISYIETGRSVELVPGAIIVFKWSSGSHHVTFCDRVLDGDYVKCIGGNQQSSVNSSDYARKYIIATRWPLPVA